MPFAAAEHGFLILEAGSLLKLIVEVVSPNDRWSDLQEKIAEYFAVGDAK